LQCSIYISKGKNFANLERLTVSLRTVVESFILLWFLRVTRQGCLVVLTVD